MRHHRRHHDAQEISSLSACTFKVCIDGASRDAFKWFCNDVDQLMNAGHGFVEGEFLDIATDGGQGLVGCTRDFQCIGARSDPPIGSRQLVGRHEDDPPDTLHEAMRTFNTGFSPDHIPVGWRIGQHEPARRIGTIGRNDVVGIDHIAL